MLRPALPIDSSALPQPVKRKSVILNTLSRLASPASKSTGARSNARPSTAGSPIPSTLPTPVVSPKAEIADPFFDDLGEVAVGTSTSANPTITGLAAYLTTLSNDQVFRQARPWKRFVRVRTDDLESVRVERAIRRVRSDVAAHLSSPSTVNVTMHNPSVLDDTRHTSREESLNGNAPVLERRASRFRENINGIENNSLHDTDPAPSLVSDGKSNSEDNMLVPDLNGDTASTAPSAKSDVIEIEASDNGSIGLPASHAADVNGVITPAPTPDADASTPVPTELPARIPRSQSADPDKAARLSRVFAQSATSVGVSGTETASASASATEDDSSVNTSHERKKRSKSTARIKERVSRKVQVSDFEMMRVLGKGCAGKVLLVRHKSSSDLYALKAITKRHVLAHQELQHTLTEQAVLRRMAAEGSDPFVVKLWWSFHDKENLFLVMVRVLVLRSKKSTVLMCCAHRTSILEVIWRHSLRVGVVLGVIEPVSTLLKSLKASRACMRQASFIVTSNRRTSSSRQTATLCSLTLAFRRSSLNGEASMPHRVPHQRQARHIG